MPTYKKLNSKINLKESIASGATKTITVLRNKGASPVQSWVKRIQFRAESSAVLPQQLLIEGFVSSKASMATSADSAYMYNGEVKYMDDVMFSVIKVTNNGTDSVDVQAELFSDVDISASTFA